MLKILFVFREALIFMPLNNEWIAMFMDFTMLIYESRLYILYLLFCVCFVVTSFQWLKAGATLYNGTYISIKGKSNKGEMKNSGKLN